MPSISLVDPINCCLPTPETRCIYRIMKKIFAAVLILSTLALVDGRAFAGNAKSFPLGDDAALTAESIGAVTRDSEGIWYNPAGLGGNQLTKVNLSGNVFMVRFQDISGGQEAILPSGTKSTDLKGNEFLAVPSAITFMGKFTDRLSYGFGVYVPQFEDAIFDSSLDSSPEQFPTIPEPVSYSQGLSVDQLDQEYQIGGALGYALTDSVRLGGGLFVIYDRNRYSGTLYENIQSADGSLDTSLSYLESTRYYIRTIGIRGTLGFQWDIVPEWRMGLFAESPTFQIYSWGDISSAVSLSGVNSKGEPVQVANRVSQSIHELEGTMIEPFHSQLSFAYVKPDYWIGLAADFYLPLNEPKYFIDKRFNWNVSVGSKFKITEKIRMGAGLFTDRSDNRSIEEFGETKVNYYGITTGVDFHTPVSRSDDPNVSPIVFSTTLAVRYALGIGSVGGLSFNPVTDGNISNATTKPYDVKFQELSAYIGTAIFF